MPIQEYRKYIEIIVVNEISDTESTDSNMRRSEREKHPEEILEPTMKGQIYMKSYKVKNIDKHTKKEPKKIWHETNENRTHREYIHKMISQTSDKIEYTSLIATTMAIMMN